MTPPKYIPLILFLLLFASQLIFGQIVFKELPRYQMKLSEEEFFDISQTRKIIPLNGIWQVYSANDKEKKRVIVGVPSLFEGDAELVFEKEFSLSIDEINSGRMRLVFLGLNYSADISLNNVIIYRHTGGEVPFHLDLPRDILTSTDKNLLSVQLYYKLDSENTIPVKQRFLFPQNFGGIFRDVYIHLTPNISVSDYQIKSKFTPANNSAQVSINAKIENRAFRTTRNTIPVSTNFNLKASLISPAGTLITFPESTFDLPFNKDKSISQTITVNNPLLWSPALPNSYTAVIELWRGGELIDKTTQPLSIYSLQAEPDSLIFNGENFSIRGVTFIPSYEDFGSMTSYEQMEKDIAVIKETGFNAVRFSKDVPHPYLLALCQRYGLLAFIELPLNAIPANISQEPNFIARSRNYLSNFISAYKKYNVAAVGVGGGFLPEIQNHQLMISSLASQVKSDMDVLTYAAFSKFDLYEIESLDLYGLEIINSILHDDFILIDRLQNDFGRGRIFISEAAYVVNAGHTNGYVNDFSYEAQAKYFEDLIDFSADKKMSGFFINSMFDYRGDFTSIISGYNPERLYNIGVMGEDRSANRLGYSVIYSKLNNTEKVTIPIGSKRDDAPMVFIIFGLALALVIGILVNSGKKFREDASRALLRPYNFFADIRDQRIMSGYHSTILGLVIACIAGLLIGNVLFHLKTNILFEKLLLAFGSPNLLLVFSYLSWHPVLSLVWITDAIIILMLLLTLLIRAASFFVRTRVYISSVFFTVIWSFLPLVLLIPVGIVLYRLLQADVANMYIYLFLLLTFFWCFYRLLKGIYVIFDANLGGVYFYSFLFIVLAAGGILLYYEMINSVISYLKLTMATHNIFG